MASVKWWPSRRLYPWKPQRSSNPVHYEYLDGDKHTPRSAEWRDSEGNLKVAAYFNYEVDSFHNWTYRQVWVWDPDLSERTLSEIDFRAITYWQ